MNEQEVRQASYLNMAFDGAALTDQDGEECRDDAGNIMSPIHMRLAGIKVKSALRIFLHKQQFFGGRETKSARRIFSGPSGKSAGEVNTETSDDRARPQAPGSPGFRKLFHHPSSSFARSMNEYMLRRLLVEDKIEAGVVVNVNEEGAAAVAVELQADLDMYDDDHQLKRSINKVFRGGLIV